MYYESFQNRNRTGLFLTLLLFAFFLNGCATTEVSNQNQAGEAEEVAPLAETEVEENEVDPYEDFNRKIFVFNDTLDRFVAKPISDAYLWVTPQFVQTGVANFFNNLKDINVVLNDTLQGKFQQGAEDSGRFVVNSTVGLLGLFDVATEIGLEKHDEDFAQTLAVWGVPEGPYLVLPVLGPSTSRGVPVGIFDTAANPTSYVGFPVQLVSMLNSRANAEGALKFIDEAALDPYVFTRESFLQYRKYLISDGKTEMTDDTLDLEDEFYDDEEDLVSSEGVTEDTQTVQANIENSVDNETAETQDHVKNSVQQKDETKLVKNGFKLQLSSDMGDFNQASGAFDEARKSFDQAAQSYLEASEKLDRLKK